uniref:Uncharacterized protein n=1 Tax=Caenorhabditis japonica TaxID=281687 RepID=A0A8R1IUC9_CAEJA
MPPVNEPTTSASSSNVWPLGLQHIKSQVDLLTLARDLLNSPATTSGTTPLDLQNANPIIATTPPAIKKPGDIPQIGLGPLGSLSIPPELLIQFSRLDHINVLP